MTCRNERDMWVREGAGNSVSADQGMEVRALSVRISRVKCRGWGLCVRVLKWTRGAISEAIAPVVKR